MTSNDRDKPKDPDFIHTTGKNDFWFIVELLKWRYNYQDSCSIGIQLCAQALSRSMKRIVGFEMLFHRQFILWPKDVI